VSLGNTELIEQRREISVIGIRHIVYGYRGKAVPAGVEADHAEFFGELRKLKVPVPAVAHVAMDEHYQCAAARNLVVEARSFDSEAR
jgi:hypothetical protein